MSSIGREDTLIISGETEANPTLRIVHEQLETTPNLWGALVPSSGYGRHFVFTRVDNKVRVGSAEKDNDIVLHGCCPYQVTLEWNGLEGNKSMVTMHDLSNIGTYIEGRYVPGNRFSILKDNTAISFGMPYPPSGEMNPNRFTFIHIAARKQDDVLDDYIVDGNLNEFPTGNKSTTILRVTEKSTGAALVIKQVWASRQKLERKRDVGQEALIMSNLNHPNICKIYDAFSRGSAYNIVLERMDTDLSTYILDSTWRDRTVLENTPKSISLQICQAVKYMHSKGIIHRDLKPENILVNVGPELTVKVTDFGIAKLVGTDETLGIYGTPAYLAPEIYARRQLGLRDAYAPPVDCYSVGAIILFCMTRRQHVVIQKRNRTEVKIPPSMVRYPAAKDCIERLLIINPSRRYTMANALRHPWLKQKHARSLTPETRDEDGPAGDDVDMGPMTPVQVRADSRTSPRRSARSNKGRHGGKPYDEYCG